MINLNEESQIIHWVRRAAEELKEGQHIICNGHKLPKRLSQEKQVLMMLELIAREPRPFVEYIETTRLRRAEVVGDGTKKSPYRAVWREDYFID